MNCKICSYTIELERLEVLPETTTCSSCAKKYNLVKPKRGILVFDHKTGGVLQSMSEDFYNENKKYFKANGARSVVKNFSKHICR
jgi:hypothetical protein